MPVTKFFRALVEGETCDGRIVSRQDIIDMAETYDPKVYAARVNLEHIRGFAPSSEFRAYGDVLSVRKATVPDGPLKGKLALEIQVDATEELVELKNRRQKIYHSVEYHPQLPPANRAYLMGLACTDNPASLGMEMMKFCASQPVSPLANRKTNEACFFSAASEWDFELEELADKQGTEKESQGGRKFFTAIMELLTSNSNRSGQDLSEIRQAVELIAGHQRDTSNTVEQLSASVRQNTDLAAQMKTLTDELSTIKTALSKMDAGGSQRPEATGNNGKPAAQLADC